MYKAYYFICGIMKIGMPKYRKNGQRDICSFSLASPGKNASILSALCRTRWRRRKCLHSRLRHLCPTQKCAEHIW